jgi:hypothetical protein
MPVANVNEMSSAATNVLAFVAPADKRQAQYFRALLKQQRAQLAEQIATDHAALAGHHDEGNHARRVLRWIAKKRLEQFELEQLLAQLERRFFGRTTTPASTTALQRRFDISVERTGSWWKVAIPELSEHVSVRQYEDIETLARAHISAVINAPMSQIAVAIPAG